MGSIWAQGIYSMPFLWSVYEVVFNMDLVHSFLSFFAGGSWSHQDKPSMTFRTSTKLTGFFVTVSEIFIYFCSLAFLNTMDSASS